MISICFDRWCSLAVSGIRFKPDRKEIYEELYAHMEDQYEELTAAGLSKKEAEDEVAAAMGDPKETARQLECIHRPFWGFALRAARWCLVIAAVLALIFLPRYIREQNFRSAANGDFFGGDLETEQSYNRKVWYDEPKAQDRSDGYTFTVTRAAERYYGHELMREDFRRVLYLEIKVFNPRPWAKKCTAIREFCAVDSLGNMYPPANDTDRPPYIKATCTRTGPFTDTWLMMIRDYRSQEANWIELRYDKAGRHLRLTLDLRGRKEAAA